MLEEIEKQLNGWKNHSVKTVEELEQKALV